MPTLNTPSVDVAAEQSDYNALQSPATLDRTRITETFVRPSLQPSSSAYELPEHDPNAAASPSGLRPHHEEDKGEEYAPVTHKSTTVLDKVGLAMVADPKHHVTAHEAKEQEALATSLSAKPTPVQHSAAAHKAEEQEKSEHGALDLTTIPLEVLATDPRTGLTSEQAAQRIIEYGYNEIQEVSHCAMHACSPANYSYNTHQLTFGVPRLDSCSPSVCSTNRAVCSNSSPTSPAASRTSSRRPPSSAARSKTGRTSASSPRCCS